MSVKKKPKKILSKKKVVEVIEFADRGQVGIIEEIIRLGIKSSLDFSKGRMS